MSCLRRTVVAIPIAVVLASFGCGQNQSPQSQATGSTPAPVTTPGAGEPTTPGAGEPTTPGAGEPTTPGNAGYYLADYNTVEVYGINVDTTPIKVNGDMYYHPVHWSSGFADTPYYAEWDLSRKCEWFISSGTGIADDAPSNSRFIFTVLTDGNDSWHQEIRLGQKYKIRLPIKNVLRIRLAVAGLEAPYSGAAVWGDAKVWCSSEPPNRKD